MRSTGFGDTVEKYSDKLPYCVLSLSCFCPYIVRKWRAEHAERADKLLRPTKIPPPLIFFWGGKAGRTRGEGLHIVFIHLLRLDELLAVVMAAWRQKTLFWRDALTPSPSYFTVISSALEQHHHQLVVICASSSKYSCPAMNQLC